MHFYFAGRGCLGLGTKEVDKRGEPSKPGVVFAPRAPRKTEKAQV